MVHAIRIHQHGGPEELRWEEVSVAAPGPGEVHLRQTAVGLNFIDIYHRSGLYPISSFPAIVGLEGAGVVVAVGEGVKDFAPGQRVAYVGGPMGAYAEERLMPASRLVVLPDWLSERDAAALMMQGITAQYLLFSTATVKAGDTVLVHAAAGGVGLLLCEWATALGATVIGTVGSPAKAEIAKAHGAAHTILYGSEDVAVRVKEITHGAGVPVVYDSVGKSTFTASLDSLRPRGLLVSFGNASGPVTGVDLGILGSKGSLYVTRPGIASYTAAREEYVARAEAVFAAVKAGKISVNIRSTLPLAEAAAAQQAQESRATTGKTVLLP